jgi:hypothetical protein
MPLLAPRPSGCNLTVGELQAQRERLAMLAPAVTKRERRGQTLHVSFVTTVDEKLVDEIVAIERECCPFLEISYERSLRQLEIATSDPDSTTALDILSAALTGGRAGENQTAAARCPRR